MMVCDLFTYLHKRILPRVGTYDYCGVYEIEQLY